MKKMFKIYVPILVCMLLLLTGCQAQNRSKMVNNVADLYNNNDTFTMSSKKFGDTMKQVFGSGKSLVLSNDKKNKLMAVDASSSAKKKHDIILSKDTEYINGKILTKTLINRQPMISGMVNPDDYGKKYVQVPISGNEISDIQKSFNNGVNKEQKANLKKVLAKQKVTKTKSGLLKVTLSNKNLNKYNLDSIQKVTGLSTSDKEAKVTIYTKSNFVKYVVKDGKGNNDTITIKGTKKNVVLKEPQNVISDSEYENNIAASLE